MEAIVLAGGMGTRLKERVSDIPKPMAPINGKPFLCYLFDYLLDQRINRIILAVGYKHEFIKEYFGDMYRNIKISYSVEGEPLGTGGAIKQAFNQVSEEFVYIVNGDTFFNVDLLELKKIHQNSGCILTMALKPFENFNRYGLVETDQIRITGFREKMQCSYGKINGGVYIANNSLFSGVELPGKFSFEAEFLEKYVEKIWLGYYISDTYFVDIGVPDDYDRAIKEFTEDYE